MTLTVKHHGAYWTDWILQASGASGGVEGWWFENENDEDEYAFGFNGGTGSVSIDFYVQTDGGGESIYVNLHHDDDDDDAFDASDELFDYFLLTMT